MDLFFFAEPHNCTRTHAHACLQYHIYAFRGHWCAGQLVGMVALLLSSKMYGSGIHIRVVRLRLPFLPPYVK